MRGQILLLVISLTLSFECPEQNYFSFTSSACLSCPSLQISTSDFMKCTCPKGSITNGLSCTECPSKVSDFSQTNCLNFQLPSCDDPNSHLFYSTKFGEPPKCVTCANGSSWDGNKCVSCEMKGTCECPEGNVKINSTCIASSILEEFETNHPGVASSVNNAKLNSLKDSGTVGTSSVGQEFFKNYFGCVKYSNTKSCIRIVQLCTLSAIKTHIFCSLVDDLIGQGFSEITPNFGKQINFDGLEVSLSVRSFDSNGDFLEEVDGSQFFSGCENGFRFVYPDEFSSNCIFSTSDKFHQVILSTLTQKFVIPVIHFTSGSLPDPNDSNALITPFFILNNYIDESTNRFATSMYLRVFKKNSNEAHSFYLYVKMNDGASPPSIVSLDSSFYDSSNQNKILIFVIATLLGIGGLALVMAMIASCCIFCDESAYNCGFIIRVFLLKWLKYFVWFLLIFYIIFFFLDIFKVLEEPIEKSVPWVVAIYPIHFVLFAIVIFLELQTAANIEVQHFDWESENSNEGKSTGVKPAWRRLRVLSELSHQRSKFRFQAELSAIIALAIVKQFKLESGGFFVESISLFFFCIIPVAFVFIYFVKGLSNGSGLENFTDLCFLSNISLSFKLQNNRHLYVHGYLPESSGEGSFSMLYSRLSSNSDGVQVIEVRDGNFGIRALGFELSRNKLYKLEQGIFDNVFETIYKERPNVKYYIANGKAIAEASLIRVEFGIIITCSLLSSIGCMIQGAELGSVLFYLLVKLIDTVFGSVVRKKQGQFAKTEPKFLS